ncbi:MAG: hypothetical protein HN719_11725 [Alphaproteobacteria bacterium]|jgi:hypothetical protein|nr:hypothetical protein [Alphaproteobacteria bacterium]
MAIILGALGLLVGLTAIWLATSAMKNIETHGDLLLQRIRNEQRKSMDDMKSKIDVAEKKIERMSDQVNNLGPEQVEE